MEDLTINTKADDFLTLPESVKANSKEEFELIAFFNETGKDWSDITSGDIKGFSKK